MHIKISEEVKKALKTHQKVVALESTIISHGLPYPDNIEVAKTLESIIREEGAIPATIAIINGEIKVGLDEHDLEILAKEDVVKVSKRDFGYVISQKKHGGTTVSGTILVAARVGIQVFATGGIGGVHRYGENTMDISRDLEELAEHSVCVVCAGAKSILDLGLTLEYLETKGVEIIGYQTEVLPSFYSRTSPFQVTHRLETPQEIATLFHAKKTFPLKGGIVVANPIPESHAMASDVIESYIEQSLILAKEKNITGKETTPFLLSTIKDLTKGESLEANKALVYNNARLAAKIAIELAYIDKKIIAF
ncbi:MAG: pseudouridine-5'-phosphate glycosidase [Firmicutes bacterium]|nr:pseudouridine-5'-phosphate glycosidase [Bacillota bacterium]